MRGLMNRRKLFGLIAWLLPVLAAPKLFPQKPTTSETSASLRHHKPFVIWSGFLTGNAFRELSEAEKAAYLEGIWDGYVLALSFAGPPAAVPTLIGCIPHLQNDQLLAIVNKHMQEHPERWGDPMGLIVYNALPKECWDF
jgi:hypothetical protein